MELFRTANGAAVQDCTVHMHTLEHGGVVAGHHMLSAEVGPVNQSLSAPLWQLSRQVSHINCVLLPQQLKRFCHVGECVGIYRAVVMALAKLVSIFLVAARFTPFQCSGSAQAGEGCPSGVLGSH